VLCAWLDAVVWGTTSLALLLVVLSIVVTVTQMEPLNSIADSWNPDALPADWADNRDQGLTWHLIRTVLTVAAFVSLLASQALAPGWRHDTRSTPAPATATWYDDHAGDSAQLGRRRGP
jgi:hypothetical protein